MDKREELKKQLTEEMRHCGFAGMSTAEQYRWLGAFIMRCFAAPFEEARRRAERERTAYYLSAEFLLGRLIQSNLYSLGMMREVREAMRDAGADFAALEEIPDHALGSGGLGRLAACFLDSAATHRIPLWGYGIRYRYGLFSQRLENGGQTEAADDWTRAGDPFSVRREEDAVRVQIGQRHVRAIPYDMPVFGYRRRDEENPGVTVLRLWQAESETPFDFPAFDAGRYTDAVLAKERDERISCLLYPNDSTDAGRELRLSQEVFFTDASVQDVLRRFEVRHGHAYEKLPEGNILQLNDTHPALAIVSMVCRLEERGVPLREAAELSRRLFAYTNHTVMREALEVWGEELLRRVMPWGYRILGRLNSMLEEELTERGISPDGMRILENGQLHTARLASFMSCAVNGVAPLHTEILKGSVLKAFHEAYPGKIQNKTNGITQRRWLGHANPALAAFITERIGDGWITDAETLSALKPYADDAASCREFIRIREENKRKLAREIERRCSVTLDSSMLFDIQIKRLHEYKRQLLNALSVLYRYFTLKDGAGTDLPPAAYLFGGKSAPGYDRAKGIIRFILAIAEKINGDAEMKDRMRVIFIPDYSVSWAEKMIPAGDLSEQISMAGTEASGTGNMKFMLNGTPTLGSYDGANLEILAAAGEENNFFFGPDAAAMAERMQNYDPTEILHRNARLARTVESLADGTFDDGGSGVFVRLYNSLLVGEGGMRPDAYCVLGDFAAYTEARDRAYTAWLERDAYAARGLRNIASAGYFSSDRTVREYARDIWKV